MPEPRIQIALVLVALLGMLPGFALGWYKRGQRRRRNYGPWSY